MQPAGELPGKVNCIYEALLWMWKLKPDPLAHSDKPGSERVCFPGWSSLTFQHTYTHL